MSRSRRSLVAAVAGLALTACEAPLAPADIAGTYVLVAYEGAPVPQTRVAYDFTRTIVADTLALQPNGTGTWIQVREMAHVAAPGPTRFSESMPVRLRRAASSLALDEAYPCDDSADCKPWESFHVQPVGEFLYLGRAPQVWTFRRVAP